MPNSFSIGSIDSVTAQCGHGIHIQMVSALAVFVNVESLPIMVRAVCVNVKFLHANRREQMICPVLSRAPCSANQWPRSSIAAHSRTVPKGRLLRSFPFEITIALLGSHAVGRDFFLTPTVDERTFLRSQAHGSHFVLFVLWHTNNVAYRSQFHCRLGLNGSQER